MVTKKELNKLKKLFRDRDLKRKLIERSGFSRANVNYVLDGRHKNKTVVEIAYKIIHEENELINKRKKYLYEKSTVTCRIGK